MCKHHTKLKIIIAAVSVLSGCANSHTSTLKQYKEEFATNPPTTDWLENNVDTLREKAWNEPTKNNVEVFAYVKGLLDERNIISKNLTKWQNQTHRLLTVDWLDEERGGAAYRKSAYEHVLTDGQVELRIRKVKPMLASDTTQFISSSLEKLKPSSYSTYELSSWQKFCNNGKGMTKADWDFVLKVGVKNIPTALIGNCTPPK